MMFVSPHLDFDPTKKLPPMVEPLCNLRMEIPADVNLHTFAAGQLWTYPLARSGNTGLVGLCLTPKTALADSAVVEVDGAQGITLASRPAYLVPVRLWERMRPGGPAWEEVAKLPAKTWKELAAFHHSLGGTDDLDAVRKLASDKKIKAAYEKGAGDFKGMVTAFFEAQQRVDAAKETAVYAKYMVKAILDKVAPVPPPDAGCWSDALTSVALAVCRHDAEEEPRPDDEAAASWRLLHQLPGLDTDRDKIIAILPGMKQTSAAKLLQSAAKVVVKRAQKEWAKDPLWPAIDALAKGKKYDGAAHFAAAAELEKAKDPAGAFTALAASSYWEVAAKGEVKRDTLDAARKLARKAKWAQVADSLDEMFETRKEVEEEAG